MRFHPRADPADVSAPAGDLARLVEPSEASIDRIASEAGREASVEPDYLGGYLQAVLSAARGGHRLRGAELEACRGVGKNAAEEGVSLPSLLDLYLSATWRLWRDINARASGTNPKALGAVAEVIFRASDDAVQVLARGYEAAQRQAIRREEAIRQEFVDDLLAGRGSGGLQSRASRFGFNLAASHVVAVARTGRSLDDADPAQGRAEDRVLSVFGGRDLVVATKEGLLVCIVPETPADIAVELPRILEETWEGPWQVGVGRAFPGPGGIVHSYEEAREALELAGRLGLDLPVIRSESLLHYRILARDRRASTEMVEGVLGPLRSARGGAEPLIETLEAYFAESMNLSATARRLYLSPRAVTYRLERIAKLTGRSPRDPEDRFVLELAVRGARLVGG
jgi:hypothetical protein